MMVLHKTSTFNTLTEIGVRPHVDIVKTEFRGGLTELSSIEHVDVLVDILEAHRTVETDMELRLPTFLRSYLNNTRGTS